MSAPRPVRVPSSSQPLLGAALMLAMLSGCRPLVLFPVRPAQVSPYAPELHFIGRVDRSAPEGPRFAWGGTTLLVRFTGTSLGLRLLDLPGDPRPNRYRVRIDDGPAHDLYLAQGRLLYRVAEGLEPGFHQLRLEKETEAFVGESQLLGLELDPGASLLPAPPAPERRLEFIGDSGLTGFGIEAPNEKCSYNVETQRASLAYPALVAEALGAEAMVLAWSGKGVAANYGDNTSPTMPQLYERTLPARPESRWDFQAWTPQAVIIHLGANDLKSSQATDEQLLTAFRALVESLRLRYPQAQLLWVLSPTIREEWPRGARSRARALLSRVVQLRWQAGDTRLHLIEVPPRTAAEGIGCDWHPSARTHRRVAKQLTPLLRELLGWR